ncbi:MAG: hypothetical protein LBW85_02495 [Deltaproteobacteria bacterium]|nr:hypothetical protein [Deltaproteobacteria bacterium]
MITGQTDRQLRDRVMLAFNSPMFPEILVTTKLLGEGIDLHRFCRRVIRHDLTWNPSRLEQRVGRLDRVRSISEAARKPIVIYEPFLAGSADEKMFRAVMDRERRFKVVLGQKFAGAVAPDGRARAPAQGAGPGPDIRPFLLAQEQVRPQALGRPGLSRASRGRTRRRSLSFPGHLQARRRGFHACGSTG